eukprot:TCALIF_13284-PA protein Name:"Similar to TRPC1 Short transient receptor potential channel 1 (Oryctolagus cuniculus)" AED:0.23 eAED:0.23 QI:0/0.5/0.33/0.66/0/0/3/161/803
MRPLTTQHSKRLNRNNIILRNAPWLHLFVRDALIGRGEFCVSQMREKTRNLSVAEWDSVLLSLNQSRKESQEEVEEFLGKAIEAFIADESKSLLEKTLGSHFKWNLKNNKHLIDAINSKSMGMVRVFVERKFIVYSQLNDLSTLTMDIDELQEIDRLEAEASPFYLLNVFEIDPLRDPVKRSFQLIHLIQTLIPHMSAFSERLGKLQINIEAFLVDLIKNINNSEKAKIFLNRDDALEELSLSSDHSSFFPRIHLGLTLNLKSFVSHDNCQKSIYDTIIDESWSNHPTPSKYCWLVLKQVILTPLVCAAFLFGGCCCYRGPPQRGYVNGLIHNLEAPINNFISHTVAYLAFVLLIILNQSNIQDQPGVDVTFYGVLLVIYAVSFLFLDIKLMYHLSKSVQSVANCRKRVQSFFSNWTYNFRFVAHFLFLIGLSSEFLGYILEPYVLSRKPKFSACALDNASTYGGYHIVSIGISCQGVGIVMILSYAIQFFRLHPTLGALYIGIRKCFSLIVSFILTYLILFGAFAIGFHVIMKHNVEHCNPSKTYDCVSNQTSPEEIYQVPLDVTLICRNGQKPDQKDCSKDCIQDWIKNQTRVNCSDGSIIQPTLKSPISQGRTVQSQGNLKNEFFRLNSTSKALFWAIFQPGNPDLVGCSDGISRQASLTLWGVYNILISIIMLNLLIALMSSTMEVIQSGKIINWKFHWTQLWMDYCFKFIILPPPINLLQLVLGMCQCCRDSQDLTPPHSTEEIEYTDLLDDLKEEYLKNFENSDLNDANKDDFDRLAKEQKLMGSKIEQILTLVRKA